MDADETAICSFLKMFPREFVGAREIARRAAGRKRFRNDSHWAAPILARLVGKEVLESDGNGHYRLKVKKDARKQPKKWISPQIRLILERSGKNFEGVYEIDEDGSNADRSP